MIVAVLFMLAIFLAPFGSASAAAWVVAPLFVMRFVFLSEG